ncbi:hypothetical protein FQN52_002191 [Onygenales sp. PD_12]|nr:hypothetical protein FQN52_002191 [Onygenales sp. PD_12]
MQLHFKQAPEGLVIFARVMSVQMYVAVDRLEAMTSVAANALRNSHSIAVPRE